MPSLSPRHQAVQPIWNSRSCKAVLSQEGSVEAARLGSCKTASSVIMTVSLYLSISVPADLQSVAVKAPQGPKQTSIKEPSLLQQVSNFVRTDLLKVVRVHACITSPLCTYIPNVARSVRRESGVVVILCAASKSFHCFRRSGLQTSASLKIRYVTL